MNKLVPALSALLATAASAHPGHGLPEAPHWHATDVAGLAIGVAVALVALWSAVRK